jgi:hypothetical protein
MNISLVIPIMVVAVVALYILWFFKRSRSMLQQWATANGYAVLYAQPRNFRRGPLLWKSSKNQAVYFIKVRDQEGRERSGWLCLGSFWTGLFSNKAKVKWEEE